MVDNIVSNSYGFDTKLVTPTFSISGLDSTDKLPVDKITGIL